MSEIKLGLIELGVLVDLCIESLNTGILRLELFVFCLPMLGRPLLRIFLSILGFFFYCPIK
jgi:hypothetical protein